MRRLALSSAWGSDMRENGLCEPRFQDLSSAREPAFVKGSGEGERARARNQSAVEIEESRRGHAGPAS